MNNLISLDASLSAKLRLPIYSSYWAVAARIAHLGDGLLVFGGMAMAYWWSLQFNVPQLKTLMYVSLLNLLVTAWIVFGLKYTIKRQRPRSPSGFASLKYDKFSFPSGHAARLSCLATTLILYNLPFAVPIGVALAVLALLVAVARVSISIHYLGDVLVGLALGVLVAVIIFVYVIRGPF